MRSFCTKYSGQTIIDVHKSFTNLDKVSALIQKNRMLEYRHGESIPAVEHEFRLYHHGKRNQVNIINIIFPTFLRHVLNLL